MKLSLRGPEGGGELCFEDGEAAFSVQRAAQAYTGKKGPGLERAARGGWKLSNFLSEPGLWEAFLEAWSELRPALSDPGFAAKARIASDTPYLPPIPEPPLFFGLAGNCPMTWRPSASIIQNYPVGYTRTRHTLTGHLGRVRLPSDVTSFRCANELGVVVGKRAFRVAKEKAMEHVAGYCVVNDMISNHWKDFAAAHGVGGKPAFLELLVTSYYGRGTAGFAPFGPHIISREEIPNPYDLMVWSRVNGVQLDRAHTNAMVVGIDTAIAYLSAFMPLEAGSVIHMGTMGLDGITLAADKRLGAADVVEMEIEKVGSLKVRFDDRRKGAA